MMDRQSRDQSLELRIIEWQVLRVAAYELNVAQPCLPASCSCPFEHLLSRVKGHYGCRAGRNRGRYDTRPACNIEDIASATGA